MTPIEELLHQWADHVNGKEGPTAYPKQSIVQSIYTFRLNDEEAAEKRATGAIRITAAGKQSRSMRADKVPEWPDTVKAIDEAMLMLLVSDRRAFYALVGFYLHKVPGRVKQDDKGLARGWRKVTRLSDESSRSYMMRLAAAMPWHLSDASLWNHKKRGESAVSAFLKGTQFS